MRAGVKSRLLASHLVVGLAGSLAASLILFASFRNQQTEYYEHALLASAYALADSLEADFGSRHGVTQAERAMAKLRYDDSERFAVLDADGRVVASSAPVGARLAAPGESEQAALAGREHVDVRQPGRPMDERIVVSVPILRDGRAVGAVRASILERDYRASLERMRRITVVVLVLVTALCVGLSLLLAQAVIRPIRQMQQLSRRIAEGDLAIRLSASNRDELGQLAADLNAMAARLQDMEATRREFLGNVSHELRTPISNIRVASEVLERRAERAGDDSARLFRTIVSETEHLEALIDELLELSAIDSGALTLEREPFELSALLGEVRDKAHARIAQKRLRVAIMAPAGLSVTADRNRLARALGNLMDNAIKFTPEGGQIVLSARNEGAAATIEVTDDGEGIAPEDMPRLFERFFRADRARSRRDGTGIGLSIVRSIVEAHGGSVEAVSARGRGSTFRMRLPAGAQQASPTP